MKLPSGDLWAHAAKLLREGANNPSLQLKKKWGITLQDATSVLKKIQENFKHSGEEPGIKSASELLDNDHDGDSHPREVSFSSIPEKSEEKGDQGQVLREKPEKSSNNPTKSEHSSKEENIFRDPKSGNGNPKVGISQDLKLSRGDFEFLAALQESQSSPILRDKTGLKSSSFYRRVSKLRDLGLITYIPKTSPRMLELTFEGRNLLPNFLRGSEGDSHLSFTSVSPEKSSPNSLKVEEKRRWEIRSHNLFYAIPIQRAPKSLDRTLQHENWISAVPMRNWIKYQGWKMFREGFDAFVTFTTRKVIIHFKMMLGDLQENLGEISSRILRVKEELEDVYPGLTLGDPIRRRVASTTSQHHGILDHPLAVKAKEIQYSARNDRWEVDSSKDFVETEGVHRVFSPDDVDFELEDLTYRTSNRVGIREVSTVLQDQISVQEKTVGNLLQVSQIVNGAAESLDHLGTEVLPWITEVSRLREEKEEDRERISLLEQQLREVRGQLEHLEPVQEKPFFGSRFQTMKQRILEEVQTRGPLTRKEISELTGIKIQTVCGRVAELEREGFVFQKKKRPCSITGKQAWEVEPKGRE